MKARIWNLLVALDQFLFCCLTFGKASPRETASAAAWNLELQGRLAGMIFRPLIDRLFWFDPDHCQTSYETAKRGAYPSCN